MWNYEKRLQYPVNITTPNAKLAQFIMSQYGGPDGEIGASMRYLSQRFTMPNRTSMAVLNDIGTEELAHLETQVKQSGLPREEFLRTLIMGAELRAKPCDHHADLLHKVAGLCNNANQLAKVANTYGEASQQSVEEMTVIDRQVWKEVKENW